VTPRSGGGEAVDFLAAGPRRVRQLGTRWSLAARSVLQSPRCSNARGASSLLRSPRRSTHAALRLSCAIRRNERSGDGAAHRARATVDS
jgi:hypothetical protein